MDWRFGMKINFWVVLLAILMAGGLMLGQLSLRAFWLDEAAVALMAKQPWSHLITTIVIDNQPWPHALIVKLWTGAMGVSEWSLRLLSALFVCLILFTMYRFGRDILQVRRVGWLAAWASATSPFLLWFGSQARGYTMAVWLGLLSWYWLMRLIGKSSAGAGRWYLGVTAVALYLHPWIAFVVASQVIVFLAARWLVLVPWRRAWWFMGLGGVSVPWVGLMLYQARLGVSSWINPVDISVLRDSMGYLVFRMGWVYLAISLVVMGVWLRSWYEEEIQGWSKRKIFLCLSLVLALVGPLVLAWLASLIRPLYVPGRYEVIVLPYLLLLLVYLWSSVRWRYWWLVVIIVLAGGGWQAAGQERVLARGLASNDETVVQYVLEEATSEDVIVTSDLSYATVKYYLDENTIDGNGPGLLVFPPVVASHPGWLDRTRWQVGSKELKSVVDMMSQEVAQENPTRVWLFYKQGVLGDVMLMDLRQAWMVEKVYVPPQPREGSWFDGVILLKRD